MLEEKIKIQSEDEPTVWVEESEEGYEDGYDPTEEYEDYAGFEQD